MQARPYFAAMASRISGPAQRDKLQLLADVERHAADITRPVVEKYGLSPRPEAALMAEGRAEAQAGTHDWMTLLEQMRTSYPGYVNDFKALEAMAPHEDRPRLALLTEHELAAIRFLDAEAAGLADSAAPLRAYLELTPPA